MTPFRATNPFYVPYKVCNPLFHSSRCNIKNETICRHFSANSAADLPLFIHHQRTSLLECPQPPEGVLPLLSLRPYGTLPHQWCDASHCPIFTFLRVMPGEKICLRKIMTGKILEGKLFA